MKPETSLLSSAHVTQDGVLTHLGRRPQKHPSHGTDAYELVMQVPLRPSEHQAIELLLADPALGSVRYSIRSSLAQLGVDGFDPEATTVVMESSKAIVTTFLRVLQKETGMRILDTLRAMILEGEGEK